MRLRVCLGIAFLTIATVAAAGTTTFRLECQNASGCVVRGELILRRADAGDTIDEQRLQIASREVTVEGAASSVWEAVISAPGFWSAPMRITIPSGQSREILPVWRTGLVEFTLRSPDGTPDGARIVIASPPDPTRKPAIVAGTYFDCEPGSEAGGWQCEIPATTLDLSVRGKGGYTPHYMWDISPTPTNATSLGTITIRKGASILAWLSADFTKHMESTVKASIRPRAVADASLTSVRLSAPLAEGTFTKKGFVQLYPLGPGRYVLDVEARGYVPARIPVEIVEGRESVLRLPIELSRSTELRLRLEPPRGPGNAPWRVDLVRRTDFATGSESAGGGQASAEGLFVAKDQAEGPVRAYIFDGDSNIYANREVYVTAGGAEQLVVLDLVQSEGSVSLGEDRLPNASLLFGGSGGKEKVRVRADADGAFSVVLPRAGKWTVDVESAEDGVAASTEVVVEDESRIEIELPSTEISGWVVDPTGAPVPAAEVMLLVNQRPMRRSTDHEGRFRFRGVPAGEVHLRATDTQTGEYSSVITAVAAKDRATNGVELRIESLRLVQGVIRSGGHPVIGARVVAYAFLEGSARRERAVTDLNGSFKFDVPAPAREIVLLVAALGSVFEPHKRAISEEQIVIDIGSRGGELHLSWAEGRAPSQLVINNVPVAIQDLFDWARANGRNFEPSGVVLPDMTPGRYELCVSTQCAEGTLPVGGNLELNAPPS